jgi:Flp pilus assembly pilin Flp
MLCGNPSDSKPQGSESSRGTITAERQDAHILMHDTLNEPHYRDFIPLDELRTRLLASPVEPSVPELSDLSDGADRQTQGILAQGISRVAQLFGIVDNRIRQALSRNTQGQTMVEYALILATIAVVAWGAYNLMGHDVGSMASDIDSGLTNA